MFQFVAIEFIPIFSVWTSTVKRIPSKSFELRICRKTVQNGLLSNDNYFDYRWESENNINFLTVLRA